MLPLELKIFLLRFLDLYLYVLLARILLSWFPAIDWYRQPFAFLNGVTEPVMAPFRNLIPPIGGLDLSPILLFLGIQILQQVVAAL